MNLVTQKMPSHSRWVIAFIVFFFAGCTSQTVRTVDVSTSEPLPQNISEELLLDVGVHLFDPNIPEDFRERDKQAISTEVRSAEANYLPYVLKSELEQSGSWGAVRVLPRETLAVDLIVYGAIVASDGERLILSVKPIDSTGRVWFDREYEATASRYSYDKSVPENIDPFRALYRRIAADLFAYYRSLSTSQIEKLRLLSELRFASEFSPDTFTGYVREDNGRFSISRLPAENDPALSRLRRVRDREYVFVDTLDSYYADFRDNMAPAYDSWREYSFVEASQARALKRQARNRTIAGAAAILGGIAAGAASDGPAGRTAAASSVLSGAYLIRDSVSKREEARFHQEALMELGRSLETEVTPMVIDLENQQISLTGTVDEQYDQWRDILRRTYEQETGLVSGDGSAPGHR